MTTTSKKQQAIFPDLPRDLEFITKDRNIAAHWNLHFQQLSMALQTNFKPEGIVIPPKPSTDIAQLTDQTSATNIIYDSTKNAFHGNITNTTTNAMSWAPFATILDFAGDPNGHVAGNLKQLCLDTVSNAVYICTTGGSSSGAVWTAI